MKRLLVIFLLIITLMSMVIVFPSMAQESGYSKVTIKAPGCQDVVKSVDVGDTVTVTFYMNVLDITKGFKYIDGSVEYNTEGCIENYDGSIVYDSEKFSVSFDSVKDSDTYFPILSQAGPTLNFKAGKILFNVSAINYKKPKLIFNTDETVLFSIPFLVTSSGDSTIEFTPKTMSALDNNDTRIISNSKELMEYKRSITVDVEKGESTETTTPTETIPTETTSTETMPQRTYILGDVDGNGSVSIFDTSYIQLSVAEMKGYEIQKGTIEFARSDVDKNKEISLFDATYIQMYLADYKSAKDLGIGTEQIYSGE